MSKNQLFKCRKLNNENDYKQFIRQFPTKLIINKIYKISKEIYFGRRSINDLSRRIYEKNIKDGNILEQDMIIQPWQFADLIYQSVLCSNDYRGMNDLSYNMVLLILLQTNEYIDLKINPIINTLHSSLDITLFLYGFVGEQFKYQNKFIFYNNLVRELYILFNLGKKYNKNLDFETDIQREIGVSWKDVIFVLYGIYLNSWIEQNIDNAINYLIFENEVEKNEVFNKVVRYYSVDYSDIRKSNLGRQIFYSKPYVVNQKNETVCFSIFFNQFIVEHALFWILRNYYKNKLKNESRKFTSQFGFLYEKYFEEICNFFSVQKEKIPECNEPRADWKLTLGEYIVLIEQKSSIFSLAIKQQITDCIKYKDEIKKRLFKGLTQLEKTEKDLKLQNTIKIVLCYDEYLDANILHRILNDAISPVRNDGHYFLANTIEIEMFLELSTVNKPLFDQVVKEMLKRNKSTSEGCLNLFNIMKDNGWKTNSYWTNQKFNEYKELIENFKNRHIKFRGKKIIPVN